MKAAVIHGPHKITCDNVEDPKLKEDRDIILKVTATAICGSDLHMYSGAVPQKRPMVMGHEFMGVVEETGKGITNLRRGDRVFVPFPIACGHCFFCEHDLPIHCEHSNPKYGPEGGLLDQKGGALFGYSDLYGGYDGGQAQYVRVPYADYGPRKVPENLKDEEVLFLTDIFPTGYTGVDWGHVEGGETVAIFGAGPVGLMAAKSAWLRGAARVFIIDTLPYRLEKARTVAMADTILWDDDGPAGAISIIRDATQGRGADVCIDAVGMEPDRSVLEKAKAVLDMEKGSIKVIKACMSAVRRGGTVSILGVYGTPFDNFPLGQMFDKGVIIKCGQAPAHKYVDELLGYVAGGRVKLDDIITHRLPLTQIENAYAMFQKKEDNCVKVVLDPWI